MQSHRLEKIVIASGVGKMRQNQQFDEKVMPEIKKELATITGQVPAFRTARKSVAGFKIRQGDAVGVIVTLRGKKMKDFLSRLINIALPRVRDFKGINEDNIDSRGNLTIGIRDFGVFPEINLDEVKVNFGIQITLVANTKTKEEGVRFFKEKGIPFKK